MLGEYSHVFAFLILGIIFVAGGLVTNMMIRPTKPNPLKLSVYECGEDPIGTGWIKFNIRFYVVALIFILFDVEIVFLFPWAVVYKQMGWLAYGEMMAFLAILITGFAYVWAKGDLDWVRPQPYIADLDDIVRRRTPIMPVPVPENVMPMPVEELVN